MKTDIHYLHWTENDRVALQRAGGSLSELLKIALDVTARMPNCIHLVSGPISTGGVGSVAGNIHVFKRAVEHLAHVEKLNVFSQIPFEGSMAIFHQKWRESGHNGEYCWPILYEFYEPLFASRRFECLHFIHGYESSTGARWEFEQCEIRGFKKRFLSHELSVDMLRS